MATALSYQRFWSRVYAEDVNPWVNRCPSPRQGKRQQPDQETRVMECSWRQLPTGPAFNSTITRTPGNSYRITSRAPALSTAKTGTMVGPPIQQVQAPCGWDNQ